MNSLTRLWSWQSLARCEGGGMVVQQFMSTSPVWCSPKDDVQSVASEMRTNSIGFVVVLRSSYDRQLLGVVTDRDVCLKVVAAGYDPRFTRVDEIMTHGGLSCKTRETIDHAFFKMQTGQVRRLPV